jgi:hypothetical protein
MTEEAEAIQVPRVPTRPRVNITEVLRDLRVGDTVRFPAGTNYGSVRTLATVHGMKVHLRMLDSGEIEVTRRC